MQVEPFTFDLSEVSKLHLHSLYSNYFVNDPNRLEHLRKTLEVFERSIKGGVIFTGQEQVTIALESLRDFDETVASRNSCHHYTIKVVRNRVVATMLFILPQEVRETINVSSATKLHIDRLTELYTSRFVDLATNFQESTGVQYPVRNFFNIYTSFPDARIIFDDVGVALDDQTTFIYNRAIRSFLDPEAVLWKAFPIVLRRYLFARIVNNQDNVLGFEEALHATSNMQISYNHPLYFTLNRIRRIVRKDKCKEDIQLLASHVVEGKDPRELGNNYRSLSAYLYNLYLVNTRIYDGERLYVQALSHTSADLLRSIKTNLLRAEENES